MLDRRTLLLSGAALAACATTPAASSTNDAAFRALVERLADATPAERSAALNAVDPDTLTFEGRLLHDAVIHGARAEASLAARAYGAGARPYPVTHRTGAYRRITSDRSDDAALVEAIDAESAQIETNAAIGVAPPDFIIDRTITLLANALHSEAFIGAGESLPVRPALTRQIEAFGRVRANAPSDAGVWRLPDGEAFYADALTLALGSRIDAREAHELARERCDHFGDLAARLLLECGYELPRHRTTLGYNLRRFAAYPEHLYAADDAGKARAVADMNATLARIRTLLPRAFEGVEDTPADVRRMSAEDEVRGAAGRREGGAYIVDLRNIRARPAWTLPSVVAHETLPGHALQAPFQQAAAPPRLQVRYASGYSEGWAIYAEMLTDELGLYNGKPQDRLGYAHWMLFRWCRVLIDTGINAMRWSRARALEEWQNLQGFDIAFATMADEVGRVCVEPGGFAAQGLSAHSIFTEREKARRDYGDAFNLKRFHDSVLRHGPLPPSALTRAVREAFAA